MAASSLWKIIGETTGLGNDKKVSCRATLSDVPTQATGPIIMTVATTPTLIDTVGMITGELIALYAKAHTGKIHIDPYTTAVVTTVGGYMPEGQFNFVTFETSISVVPSAQAVSAASLLEYALVAVS